MEADDQELESFSLAFCGGIVWSTLAITSFILGILGDNGAKWAITGAICLINAFVCIFVARKYAWSVQRLL